MTRKWYAKLRHSKMHLHFKFGIPTSKNVEDIRQTRSRTDGRTVRLLYASQSFFGGKSQLILWGHKKAFLHVVSLRNKLKPAVRCESSASSAQKMSSNTFQENQKRCHCNSFMPKGMSHPYQMDESISNLRVSG